MKPDLLILLRHGESQGNTNKQIYAEIPDYAVDLTSAGCKQARAAGQQLRAMIEKGTSIAYYISPYWRTRRTYEFVREQLADHCSTVYEDPRLREQEWSGDFRAKLENYDELEARRDSYGHFYFRIKGGESCADVFDRVSDFMSTLHRDFEKADFPRNCIIVSHGMTNRLFLMRWFHWTVEQFEKIANPVNCEYYVLRRNQNDHHYSLLTEPREHTVRHQFQYVPRGTVKVDMRKRRKTIQARLAALNQRK
jgi:broad specificity phosphatase PhoE